MYVAFHETSTVKCESKHIPFSLSRKRRQILFILIAIILTGVTYANDSLHPQELSPVRYGKSKQRLDDLLPPAPSLGLPRKAEPVRLNPNITAHLGSLVSDPLVVTSESNLAAGVRPVLRSGFPIEGIGDGWKQSKFKVTQINPYYQVQLAPPDTNGAVGETQFVQWVNNSIAIFDKNTGMLEYGPIPGNYLWKNFGGNCEVDNNGDAVAEYDKFAKRWFLAQFSTVDGKQTGYSECIAVSTSSDATGDYWLYEFQYPSMNDYPKIAVWPDGYYASFNMYDEYVGEDGRTRWRFLGARACVYDREAMLAGKEGRQECFQLSDDKFGLLPSDLDGNILPPAGAPNVYVSLGSKPDTLDLWKFKIDWKNPDRSTFGKSPNNSPNATIPVEHFNLACNGTGATCVRQPIRVEQQEELDSLGDRLMFRAAYRRFKSYESLLLNHSVDTGGANSRTAVRWYELRDLANDTPVVFQQGTFSPDETDRWIGSMAMDRNGNIAIGYNASSRTVYPGIRIAARLRTDPLGLMGSEVVVRDGTGIQTCSPAGECRCNRLDDGSCETLTRWGDYSSVTLDPTDDCTYWFSTEYQRDDGAYNWHTSIISFTVGDSCPMERRSGFHAEAPTSVPASRLQ